MLAGNSVTQPNCLAAFSRFYIMFGVPSLAESLLWWDHRSNGNGVNSRLPPSQGVSHHMSVAKLPWRLRKKLPTIHNTAGFDQIVLRLKQIALLRTHANVRMQTCDRTL